MRVSVSSRYLRLEGVDNDLLIGNVCRVLESLDFTQKGDLHPLMDVRSR